MERLAGRLAGRRWPRRPGRGGAADLPPAGSVRTERRTGDPVPAVVAADPLGLFWSAALHLGGGRRVDASYPVDPPLMISTPLPRVAVRSLPTAPMFSLDLRLSTSASLLYVGVLHYTDGRSRPGRARVAGTWSAPTATFRGSWLGASSQRGTVRVTLRQG